jgi:AcrR family transcriptional regulator
MPIIKTTKEEIIWKSLQLFRKQGYYRTSMADLATATGLTKGVFYHHFSSKEELMKTALQTMIQWFDDRVFSVAYQPQLSPQERLEKMTETAYKAFTNELGGCLVANTVLETAHVEDTFLDKLKLFFQLWEKAIAKVFEEKYAPQVLPEIAQQIIADIEGSIILMQLHKNPLYLQKALYRTKQLLNRI